MSPSDLPSALPVQQTSDRGRMIGLTMIADNCDKVFVLVARTASVVYRRARRFLPMLQDDRKKFLRVQYFTGDSIKSHLLQSQANN